MNDESLEKIKSQFSQFKNLDDFKSRFLDVAKPNNKNDLIEFYEFAFSNEEAWEIYKVFNSSETIRLDKILTNPKISEILYILKSYNLDNFKRVLIKLENKDYEDIEKLKNLGIDFYISIVNDKGLSSVDEFINMRQILSFFKNEYSTYNLSNLEKITLCYDFTKFFSYNVEIRDYKTDSRSVAKSLYTGYIVCEGYAKIFCALLKELGIDSNLVYIKDKKNNRGGHGRLIVNIDDSKYNIKSPYAFDPTWDSNHEDYLVSTDEKEEYKSKKDFKENDIAIRKLPSSIRYLDYLVPLNEYSLYFKDEEIDRIVKYSTGEKVPLTNELLNYMNSCNGREKTRIDYSLFDSLIRKIKKIEGYSDNQIDYYINDALNIMKKERYKINDNLVKKV